MKRKEMPKVVFKLLDGVKKEAPTLMSIGAAVGVGVTVYLSLRAKPKADAVIERRKETLERIDEPEVEVVEKEEGTFEEVEHVKSAEEKKVLTRQANIAFVLDMGKAIALPLLSGGTTIFLIFMANRINLKRLSALGVAYKVSSDELKKYKEKTKEIVGEKKDAEIRNAVAADEIEKLYKDDLLIYETGKGSTVYFDKWSGRFFRSSRVAIQAAVNEVNRLAIANDSAGLDEFYYALGLPEAGFAENFEYSAINGSLMEEPTYAITTLPNGEHATMLDYDIYPRQHWDGSMY